MFLPKDQIDLLSAFNAHGVEYLIVGAHAVNAFTQPRSTKDLDVFIRNDRENSIRVFRALADFGAPLAGESPDLFFGHPETCFQIGVEPDRVDILQGLSGITFEDAWKDAIPSSIAGVPCRFLSRDHLITNKLASGRLRDLADVEELRKFMP